ncbi:MAG: DUF1570 domain-containing protein [Thermogutta sp.]|nr:DUF1570 domain-containing protein [Thermogutta sp.]
MPAVRFRGRSSDRLLSGCLTVCTFLMPVLAGDGKAAAQSSPVWMMDFSYLGERIQGTPLTWSENTLCVLARDGRLLYLDRDKASDFRKIADRFQALDFAGFKAAVLREFGNDFSVTSSTHYLIISPQGVSHAWKDRLEHLFRSATRYYSTRGFPLRNPDFLLPAVICPTWESFQRTAAREGTQLPPGTLGYYDRLSNRILLWDAGSGNPRDRGGIHVLAHEGFHQWAFNVGLHNRVNPPPLWVAEGLATLFESSGVFGGDPYSPASRRVHPARLATFTAAHAGRDHAQWLRKIVQSDAPFRENPALAYAEAWAAAFYFTEREPAKFVTYLRAVNDREPSAGISGRDREAEFTGVFGSDWGNLETRIGRFLSTLRP